MWNKTCVQLRNVDFAHLMQLLSIIHSWHCTSMRKWMDISLSIAHSITPKGSLMGRAHANHLVSALHTRMHSPLTEKQQEINLLKTLETLIPIWADLITNGNGIELQVLLCACTIGRTRKSILGISIQLVPTSEKLSIVIFDIEPSRAEVGVHLLVDSQKENEKEDAN